MEVLVAMSWAEIDLFDNLTESQPIVIGGH